MKIPQTNVNGRVNINNSGNISVSQTQPARMTNRGILLQFNKVSARYTIMLLKLSFHFRSHLSNLLLFLLYTVYMKVIMVLCGNYISVFAMNCDGVHT